jgi:hypothetical protein
MKQFILKTTLVAVLVTSLISCDKDDDDDYQAPPVNNDITVIASAGDSAAVLPALDQFRAAIGNPVNNTPGAVGGRREVNWDGVGPAFSNNNAFPIDFFNSTDPAVGNGRKRGLQYANNGTLLRVDSTDYSEIDPSYAAQFQPFTGKRQIAPVGTNITEVVFKVPGTNTDAFVKGFGVMFSDVDLSNTTSIELFDGNTSLGIAKALPSNGKYSFLSLRVQTGKITRAKIITGNAALGAGVKDVSDNGSKDVVVMDDFFYSEPVVNQ